MTPKRRALATAAACYHSERFGGSIQLARLLPRCGWTLNNDLTTATRDDVTCVQCVAFDLEIQNMQSFGYPLQGRSFVEPQWVVRKRLLAWEEGRLPEDVGAA